MKLIHKVKYNEIGKRKCFCGKDFYTGEDLFYHIGAEKQKIKNIIELGFKPLLHGDIGFFFYRIECKICGKIYRANQQSYIIRHSLRHTIKGAI